jgi:nicotinamidase-related amidase/aminoglycoside phosphotransferase (APT) family kinase protein
VQYLLFSECLQNDFVAPMPAGAPLPNELHIGRAESRRLLGDPEGPWAEEGPLARFLGAFPAGAGRDHASVHIRDWHDPADPATRAHLEHFGSHCVRGTPGAAFVAPLAPLVDAGGIVVDSAVLSDFVGTTLEASLRPLLSGPARAGIIGVWTDFKVQYLAYELQTRLGLGDVAVCGALTASRSRLAHRQALEHMAANLGVSVLDSIPEFLAWLGIEAPAVTPAFARGRPRPAIGLPEGVSLDDEERRLVEHLYRGCRSVELRPIGGGYSGSRVFGSSPVDRMGRREIPFVTKIDRHDRIARERVAVEGVENLLGANAPRLADYVDLETRGAIKYHFATMHAGEVRTLQRAFREAPGPEAARALLDRVIDRVLRRLYQSPTLDRLDLFSYYGYQPRYAETTLARAAELARSQDGDGLLIEGLAAPLPHPRCFYERLRDQALPEAQEVACATVHGDLNLANVLLDDAFNTWLIDYFWTRSGHVLDDVAKLENDLKFIMLPLPDDAALVRAFELERHLQRHEDLLRPPGDPAPELLGDPGLAKVSVAVARLRELAAELLREAGLAGAVSAREYWIAQLRYSAHTLSFVECDLRQKRFALASTCLLADRLKATLASR